MMKENVKNGKRNNLNRYRITAVCAMILLIFSMLLTGVQIAVYGDSDYGFYRREYEKYLVPHALQMDIEEVMAVTDHMMDYLIGKEEVLSVDTEVDGSVQDFFNEQDRLHMADVKNLFLGGLRVRTICLILALILLVAVYVRGGRDFCLFGHAYLQAFVFFAMSGLLLAVAFSIDFTRCFTIFHQIFFTNDLWLFDPAEDYMIRMLPEGFFSDMAIRIAVVFGMECVLAGGIIAGAGKMFLKIDKIRL